MAGHYSKNIKATYVAAFPCGMQIIKNHKYKATYI